MTITNKEAIAATITKATQNTREILTIALALNTWVAATNPGTEGAVSLSVVEQVIAGTVGRW